MKARVPYRFIYATCVLLACAGVALRWRMTHRDRYGYWNESKLRAESLVTALDTHISLCGLAVVEQYRGAGDAVACSIVREVLTATNPPVCATNLSAQVLSRWTATLTWPESWFQGSCALDPWGSKYHIYVAAPMGRGIRLGDEANAWIAVRSDGANRTDEGGAGDDVTAYIPFQSAGTWDMRFIAP